MFFKPKNNTRHHPQHQTFPAPPPQPHLMALEPRIMFDGAGLASALDNDATPQETTRPAGPRDELPYPTEKNLAEDLFLTQALGALPDGQSERMANIPQPDMFRNA